MALAVGGFAQTDWRPVAFGFGGGCLAAFLALVLLPLAMRGSLREAFIAFAIAQRPPVAVLAGILSIGVGALLAAISPCGG